MFNIQLKNNLFLLLASCFLLLASCSIQKQISKSAEQLVIKDSSLLTAHVGISIYDPASSKYWYNYQGDKYFVPASNTKLPTCYAAMKYLGDSLVGLRWENSSDYVIILGSGDPTFLHTDFKNQPVFDFLKKAKEIHYIWDGYPLTFSFFGRGWTLDDYLYDYSAERSEMPIYGNLAKFYMRGDTVAVNPSFFYNYSIHWLNETLRNGAGPWFTIVRPFENNSFHGLSSSSMYRSKIKFSSQFVPFRVSILDSPYKFPTFISLLEDTLHIKIGQQSSLDAKYIPRNILHSRPTDSLLKPMMHRSDNFFAEQTLLMVSNERLGVMNDERIIDTLLKTDFKDLPQKPRWVDGSGLSRYNLFTPQDFVAILNKMKNEFPMERIKNILPTGGEGTLSGNYKADSNYIFAKTGTLGGIVALSGYLYTKKGRLLIFSTLINNHQGSATNIRKAIEKFLEGIRNKY